MGGDDHSNMGFQQRGGSHLNCPNSGIYANSMSAALPTCKTSNGVDVMFGTDWDPLVSLSQNVDMNGSSMASHSSIAISPYSMLENQGTSGTSHLLRYPSDSSLVELSPKISSFGSGSFSAMVSSFGLSEYDQIANGGCSSNYPTIKEGVTNKIAKKVDDQISDDGGSVPSPDGKKRKRGTEHRSGIGISPFDSVQNVETGRQKEASQESTEDPKEHDDKKQKTGKNTGTNLRGKQCKDGSENGESSKEDYIHVRARRGQATNSHSLAERVRREKISQRMRFLQDLVPGCNKITGKALMLDEIINYVQSLQRQVEFLSMKLATVNPDLNIDIDRILSKEILHSRGEGSAMLGFGPGMSSSHHQPQITHRGGLQAAQSQLPHFLQMPSGWDDDLQNAIQMGLLSNPALESLGLNGHMKVEL